MRIACLAGVIAAAGAFQASACPVSARPIPAPVLERAQSALAEGRPLSVLAIGSSSTAGFGASSPQKSYPAQLAHYLSTALGAPSVHVINAGVSGERGGSTLRRLNAFLAQPDKPDLIIWQVGTNDYVFGGQPRRLADIVSKGLAAAKAADVPVIIVDQQYFPLIVNVRRYEGFVGAVNETARAYGTPVLPRYAMMKEMAARDPEGFRGLLAWDRFHMNDAGYACLARLLGDSILESLKPGQKRVDAAARAPSASIGLH